jgi:DNA-binding IclR family transcriptional regulator
MKQNRSTASIYRVQALERALDILDCFNFQNRELTLSQIAERTGLNKTTAKRLLSNLTNRGYLRQSPEVKTYQLGLRLFELGGVVFSSFSLRKAAAYPMSELQNETGATVLMGVMMEDELVYIDKREGRGMIRISSDIGWRRPLHYGMLGMVLMAFIEPEKVNVILKKRPLKAYSAHSITDREAFGLRLEKIRRQGYIVENEEAVDGISGIAAPIWDYSGHVIAALGIVLAVGQARQKNDADRYVRLVTLACEKISSDLGYPKI